MATPFYFHTVWVQGDTKEKKNRYIKAAEAKISIIMVQDPITYIHNRATYICNFPWWNPHHNQDLGFSVTLKSHMSCMSSNYKGLGFFSGGTKYAPLRAVFSDIMSYLIVRKINIPVFQNNSHTWNKNAYSAVWLDTNIVILLCHIFIPQELHLISFHTLPCCTGKKNCCSV